MVQKTFVTNTINLYNLKSVTYIPEKFILIKVITNIPSGRVINKLFVTLWLLLYLDVIQVPTSQSI